MVPMREVAQKMIDTRRRDVMTQKMVTKIRDWGKAKWTGRLNQIGGLLAICVASGLQLWQDWMEWMKWMNSPQPTASSLLLLEPFF